MYFYPQHLSLGIPGTELKKICNIIRIAYYKKVKKQFNPSLFLIRVPDFERDWSIPFRKKIGTNYYSDKTHYIEHTEIQFRKEIIKSGLQIRSLKKNWSEIWAVCENKID